MWLNPDSIEFLGPGRGRRVDWRGVSNASKRATAGPHLDTCKDTLEAICKPEL